MAAIKASHPRERGGPVTHWGNTDGLDARVRGHDKALLILGSFY